MSKHKFTNQNSNNVLNTVLKRINPFDYSKNVFVFFEQESISQNVKIFAQLIDEYIDKKYILSPLSTYDNNKYTIVIVTNASGQNYDDSGELIMIEIEKIEGLRFQFTKRKYAERFLKQLCNTGLNFYFTVPN